MRLVSIDEIIEKAFETGDLATGGLLNPEQAAAFVRKVIDSSVVLQEARREPMVSPKKWIEKIGFGARIMIAATESTAPGSTSEPTTEKVELSVVEALAAVDLSYSALEDNIERQGLQNTLLELIAERVALDLEELALYGDTNIGAGDPYLDLLDGFFKQATSHVVDWGSVTVDKGLFTKMIKKLPGKYLRRRSEWRFYVSNDVDIDYRNLLAERATGAGDRFLLEDAPVFAGGVPIIPVPSIKTASGKSSALLVHPQNLIAGFHRDVMTEVERKPRTRTIETTTTVRVDFKFEEEDAAVEATNILHVVA